MLPIRALFASFFLVVSSGHAHAQDETALLDALVAAYPDALSRHDGKSIHWRDGTVMRIGDAAARRPLQSMLRDGSIIEQLRMPYAKGPLAAHPARDFDPGRVRHSDFFKKMYGDCQQGQVIRHMVAIKWLPKTWGKSVRVTSVNGVAEKLRAVSAEIDELPAAIKKAAYPIAGVYNCRAVADSGAPSVHSYAAAIDLNTAFSDYWHWQKQRDPIAYRNRMPQEIVAIFEKHGFIWGGKWYHYDTMHFEYRPELLR